jgi:Uma2 family endonuclease
MSTLKQAVYYPDSDGKPVADNTLQFEWIVTVQGNLDLMFRDDPNVFVAGDHLIYPVEDDDTTRQAPDVYVAFGRPKGHRGSYKVWEEGGTFPQVIFEVWSPGNRVSEMDDKREFYAKYGAEEYNLIHPEHPSHVDA